MIIIPSLIRFGAREGDLQGCFPMAEHVEVLLERGRRLRVAGTCEN